jgi:hypothetical protein
VRRLVAVIVLAAAGTFGSAGTAQGCDCGVPGPIVGGPGVTGQNGVTYLAGPRRGGRTTVESVDSGWPYGMITIDGSFGIPRVARDGTTGGLSGDDRTLVLQQVGGTRPAGHTRFAIIAARSLHLRRVLRLAGSFSYDAISPDGATLYLIQHLGARRDHSYLVRAYDLARGRLAGTPVFDPEDGPSPMNGYPVARVPAPDGRWQYTLYGQGHGRIFIHALDTVARRAVCIGLPHSSGGRPGLELLTGDDWGIGVTRAGTLVATVDTTSFRVTPWPHSAPPASPLPDGPVGNGDPGDGLGIVLGVLTLLALGGAGIGLCVRSSVSATGAP